MKNPSKIKFGIIGCGAMGNKHAQLITENDASELLIVADIKKEAAGAVGEKFGVKQITTDIEEVINHPQLDAVIVATPSYLHADVVVDAAKAGKHVFCEKPPAMTIEDADRMIDACGEANVLLQIGLVCRWAESRQKLGKIIQSGAIGRPIVYRILSPLGAGDYKQWMHELDKGGGPFIEGAVHDFDFIRHTVGEPESVYAAALGIKPQGYSDADTGTAIIKFENQDILVYSVSWGLPGLEGYGYSHGITRHDIIGPKGYALKESNGDSPMTVNCYENGSEKEVATIPWPGSWGVDSGAYPREIDHFIKCIQKGEQPIVTGEDGKRALEMGLAILESAKTGEVVRIGHRA